MEVPFLALPQIKPADLPLNPHSSAQKNLLQFHQVPASCHMFKSDAHLSGWWLTCFRDLPQGLKEKSTT